MATEAQLAASGANAQLSTGPASPEGKAIASRNAGDEPAVLSEAKIKRETGLTGQTVLLPSDDVVAYQAHVARFHCRFEPATDDERERVQAIADTEWRLLRIPALEANMLAVARHKLAHLYPEVADASVRASLIEGEIQFTSKKDFASLSVQEMRLLRRRRLETEALERLQLPAKRPKPRAARCKKPSSSSSKPTVPATIPKTMRMRPKRHDGGVSWEPLFSRYTPLAKISGVSSYPQMSPALTDHLKQLIREVPDFPKPGINFYDITTLLKNKNGFRDTIDALGEHYRRTPIDIVIGIEARGYFFAPAMAHALGAGFVPVRKPKKLPHTIRSIEYELEYGTDQLEIHADAIEPGQNVLIIDDVLATGGTASAVARLVRGLEGRVVGLGFVIELTFLNGRRKLPDYDVFSLLQY
jgi:adenine phosphoribosyltransferase